MQINVEWTSEQVFVGTEEAPPTGYAPQWTVTASKQLGPHMFVKSRSCQQLGRPPIIICRELEQRVCRELENEMLWRHQIAEEGVADRG